MWKKFTNWIWNEKDDLLTYTKSEKTWRLILFIPIVVLGVWFIYRWIFIDGFLGTTGNQKDFYTVLLGGTVLLLALFSTEIREKALERRIKEFDKTIAVKQEVVSEQEESKRKNTPLQYIMLFLFLAAFYIAGISDGISIPSNSWFSSHMSSSGWLTIAFVLAAFSLIGFKLVSKKKAK